MPRSGPARANILQASLRPALQTNACSRSGLLQALGPKPKPCIHPGGPGARVLFWLWLSSLRLQGPGLTDWLDLASGWRLMDREEGSEG